MTTASYSSEPNYVLVTEAEREELFRLRVDAERLRQVLDAGKSLVHRWRQQGYQPDSDWATPEAHEFVTAINLASVSPA